MTETLWVIRNLDDHGRQRTCKGCGKIHDYITRGCTPIGFSWEELRTGAGKSLGNQWHHAPDGMKTTSWSAPLAVHD